jgi:hypothetical protein
MTFFQNSNKSRVVGLHKAKSVHQKIAVIHNAYIKSSVDHSDCIEFDFQRLVLSKLFVQ